MAVCLAAAPEATAAAGEGGEGGEGGGEGGGGGDGGGEGGEGGRGGFEAATDALLEALEGGGDAPLQAAVAAAAAAGHEGASTRTDAATGVTHTSRWCSSELKEARAALDARMARRTWRELGREMEAARADDAVARHGAMARAPVRDHVT